VCVWQAVAWATGLAFSVTIVASIGPIRTAMASSLRDALDFDRPKSTAVKYNIERAEDRNISWCVCVGVCGYVYACVSVYVCGYVYASWCVCGYVCACVWVCVGVGVRCYVYACVCQCVCGYACVCVPACVLVYVCVHACDNVCESDSVCVYERGMRVVVCVVECACVPSWSVCVCVLLCVRLDVGCQHGGGCYTHTCVRVCGRSVIAVGSGLVVFGFAIYYLIPLALLSLNLELFVNIFFWILMATLIGMVMIAINVELLIEVCVGVCACVCVCERALLRTCVCMSVRLCVCAFVCASVLCA